MNRVVITGTGALSAYGIGAEELWHNLLLGNTKVVNIPESWKLSPQSKGLYSPLPLFDYQELGFSRMEVMQYEPVNLHILIALGGALKSANIHYVPAKDRLNSYLLEDIDLQRFGVFGGTGIGGINTLITSMLKMKAVQSGERGRLDTFTIAKAMPNNVSAAMAIKLNIHKNTHSYAYACATGTITIGKAYEQIKSGALDIAVAGSSEYFDKEGAAFNSFSVAKTLVLEGNPPEANCPFDKHRKGFLFSEGGSGVVVLESLAHAKRRNAPILAEIVGFSESFDGFNMVSGDPSGLYIEEMLRQMLKDAEVDPLEISYINAHGTGTLKNDEIESLVFEKIFGNSVAINSTKSFLGHTIAASGSIETIVTALSIRDQRIHGNNALKAPLRPLNFAVGSTEMDIEYALSTSSAFGGHNAALLFRKYL